MLVFFIPGIRSNALWAQNIRQYANSPTARNIVVEIVTGPDHLGLTDLLLRHRLWKFRSDYKQQITSATEKRQDEHGALDIYFVCHSMGSSLFAEILEELELKIREKQNSIKNIVFLGSVCRRTASTLLGKSCKQMVNDVGQKDIWPVVASIINPLKYDFVGRFGFSRTMIEDRFFPNNNHSSCTELDHFTNWILPIIEDGIIKNSGVRLEDQKFNTYRLVVKLFWPAIILSVTATVLFI